MPRRTAAPEPTPLVDIDMPFDPEGDVTDPDVTSPAEYLVPQVFQANPSEASISITKRSISVTVKRHQGSDKNQGPLVNTTVEVTLGEEGPMDFARQLKTAQLLCNEAHDVVGNALGIDTVEGPDGWVTFGQGAPSPFPQQALQAPMPQQPMQYVQQPQQYPQVPQPQQFIPQQGGGGGGQNRQANYDDHTKGLLSQLYQQQPHLFSGVEQKTFDNGKTKLGMMPSPMAFQAIGVMPPAQIKKLWL